MARIQPKGGGDPIWRGPRRRRGFRACGRCYGIAFASCLTSVLLARCGANRIFACDLYNRRAHIDIAWARQGDNTMGVAPGHLWLYTEWLRDGLLKRGGAVLELGAQELFCVADPSHINRFVEQFGGEPFPDDDVIRLANRGLAGEIFARAGSPYASIDCKPYPFGIVMDLNHDSLPAEHHARYGLVTNHGTSEHIANQWNVAKTIHDATAEGGLMLHAVPVSGEWNTGCLTTTRNSSGFWQWPTAIEPSRCGLGLTTRRPRCRPASRGTSRTNRSR